MKRYLMVGWGWLSAQLNCGLADANQLCAHRRIRRRRWHQDYAGSVQQGEHNAASQGSLGWICSRWDSLVSCQHAQCTLCHRNRVPGIIEALVRVSTQMNVSILFSYGKSVFLLLVLLLVYLKSQTVQCYGDCHYVCSVCIAHLNFWLCPAVSYESCPMTLPSCSSHRVTGHIRDFIQNVMYHRYSTTRTLWATYAQSTSHFIALSRAHAWYRSDCAMLRVWSRVGTPDVQSQLGLERCTFFNTRRIPE